MTASRVVCSEDTRIPHGFHKHKCQCGTTWFHDMDEAEVHSLSHEEFVEAHSCPNCGIEVREKYFHSKAEERASNEAICLLLEIRALMDLFEGKSIEFEEV